MQRHEILENILKKVVLPIGLIGLALMAGNYFAQMISDGGRFEYPMWFFILSGFPFGIFKLRTWLFSGSGASLQFTVAIFILNLLLAGIIGGFILIWKGFVAIANLFKCIYYSFRPWSA